MVSNGNSFGGKLKKVLASMCSLVVGASGVSQAFPEIKKGWAAKPKLLCPQVGDDIRSALHIGTPPGVYVWSNCSYQFLSTDERDFKLKLCFKERYNVSFFVVAYDKKGNNLDKKEICKLDGYVPMLLLDAFVKNKERGKELADFLAKEKSLPDKKIDEIFGEFVLFVFDLENMKEFRNLVRLESDFKSSDLKEEYVDVGGIYLPNGSYFAHAAFNKVAGIKIEKKAQVRIDELEEQLKQLQDYISEKEKEVKKLENERSKLDKELENNKKSLSDAKEENSKLQKSVNESESVKNDLNLKLNNLNFEKNKLELNLKGLESKLNEEQLNYNAGNNKLAAKTKELSTENVKLKNENKQLNNKNEELEKKNKNLSSENKNLNSYYENLKKKNENLNNDYEKLNKEKEELKKNNENLKNENKKLLKQVDAGKVSGDSAEAESKVKKLKSDLAAKESEVEQLKSRLNGTNVELSNTQSELSKLKNKVSKLEEDLKQERYKLRNSTKSGGSSLLGKILGYAGAGVGGLAVGGILTGGAHRFFGAKRSESSEVDNGKSSSNRKRARRRSRT